MNNKEVVKNNDDLKNLQQKLSNLLRERDELATNYSLLNQKYDEISSVDEENQKKEKEKEKFNKKNSGLDKVAHQLPEICKLSGVMISQLDEQQILIQLQTLHKGVLLEVYSIILVKESKTNKLIPYKHTIPHFIQFQSISNELLNSNFEEYLNTIYNLMNSFVSRREQYNECKEKITKEKQKISIFCSNQQYLQIEIEFNKLPTEKKKKQKGPFRAQLFYEKSSILPSKVNVFREVDDEDSNRKIWKIVNQNKAHSSFLKNFITQALMELSLL
ncbi:inner kinetochore subunit mal2 [Anaeramoeba flamelloides]|uniref:Inner kinetochore subunit mal2 n=1 Tax=Anaeramoeba flamelloides TaxID=1746091 RepID=A0ABQ8XLF8_9EUKA|nr:inner kinetochore subunit mal2 [Anaeramoeba flamelloides]